MASCSSGEKRTLTERFEQRAVIKFCANSGMTPTETWKFFSSNSSVKKCSRTIVFDWHKRFRDGRVDISDDLRSGRPRISDSARNVQDTISDDKRRSVQDIADMTGLSLGTVHDILTSQLEMNKVCARWVPRLLTSDEMTERVKVWGSFLARFRKDGDNFLDRIVTTDETIINFYDPETKKESMVWKRRSSPPPKKARVTKSSKKIMFIFFMDRRGMLLQHAVPDKVTVNKEYHQKVSILRQNFIINAKMLVSL